jgi:Holliday junction resolvase
MPNANYLKGVRRERKLVNAARARGLISFRSAGSHSPMDVCVIDKEHRQISFVQCKGDSFKESEKRRLMKEFDWLSGSFLVTFEVYDGEVEY